MIRMLLAIRGTITRLWNFGTGSARLVIRIAVVGVVFGVVIPLLVWPFCLLGISLIDSYEGTGFTAIAMFLPLVAFLVFAIFSVVFLAMAYPLLSGVLVAIPGLRSFLGWFVVGLVIVVFGEFAIGLYLAFVPVWALPWWIAFLAGLVVFLGLWQFLKWRLGWRWGGWITPTLATAIVFVTLAFFVASIFGGKEETEERVVAIEAAPRVEPFTLNAGEEKFICRQVGRGTQHLIQANKPWVALSRDDRNGTYKRPDGNYRPENYGADEEVVWRGAAPAGPLLARGLEAGTILTCERIDR